MLTVVFRKLVPTENEANPKTLPASVCRCRDFSARVLHDRDALRRAGIRNPQEIQGKPRLNVR